jgi:hypothetical protein
MAKALTQCGVKKNMQLSLKLGNYCIDLQKKTIPMREKKGRGYVETAIEINIQQPHHRT